MTSTLAAKLGDDATRKKRERAQARAALLGIELHITDDDRGRVLFVASMHAMTRCFEDLAAVEAWLDRIGAPK